MLINQFQRNYITPTKRAGAKNIETGKSKPAIIPRLCNEIRYDQIGHWPESVEKNGHFCLCQAYSGTRCSKCYVPLCLLKDQNYFKYFHILWNSYHKYELIIKYWINFKILSYYQKVDLGLPQHLRLSFCSICSLLKANIT